MPATRKAGRRVATLLAVPLIAAAIVLALQTRSDAETVVAKATLNDASGNNIGLVKFVSTTAGLVARVTVTLPPTSAEFHGFHVHSNSDPANGVGCIADPLALPSTWFVSADGHWNPDATTHGHHAGDMPSLLRDDLGRATMTFKFDDVVAADLIGKAVIIHAGPDNFANVPLGANTDQYTANSQAAIDKTNATGNAGDRFACGVVTS